MPARSETALVPNSRTRWAAPFRRSIKMCSRRIRRPDGGIVAARAGRRICRLDRRRSGVIKDWGFDLAATAVPVTVWQGDLHLMVPFAHGEWLRRHVHGTVSRGARPRQLLLFCLSLRGPSPRQPKKRPANAGLQAEYVGTVIGHERGSECMSPPAGKQMNSGTLTRC
jgi:hypothetical protein